MIKVNELRIENFISDDEGVLAKVTGFAPLEHSVRCDEEEGCHLLVDCYLANGSMRTGCETDSPECEPIPLTPEWLQRCGLFENGSSYKGELRFKGCGHLTIETIENGGLGYFAPFNKTIEIKYLHQLQNLYFALTGEELKIELP